MQRNLCVAALLSLVLSATTAAQTVPSGTVLPVLLNSTLDARHDKPGKNISGKVMQDVPLPDGGARIPKGAKIFGQVVRARPASAASPAQLTVKFDRLEFDGKGVSISAHLRALASMTAVFEARMPTNSWDDYGTSQSDWNTIQVGGAGVFRGSGQVIADGAVVGQATDYGAVTARLISAPKSGCHADEGPREQALWVFSPWACGPYGFVDLRIAHAGRTDPVGEIEFLSQRNVYIQGGSGWLLRTEGETPVLSRN